jgi:hypothetical protein
MVMMSLEAGSTPHASYTEAKTLANVITLAIALSDRSVLVLNLFNVFLAFEKFTDV